MEGVIGVYPYSFRKIPKRDFSFRGGLEGLAPPSGGSRGACPPWNGWGWNVEYNLY